MKLLLVCAYAAAYQLGTVKRPGDLVGVCPGAVVAGKGEPFIGTFITKIQQSGAKWFRYPFGMDGISRCSGGCYNWDGWTPWVTSAVNHGLTVLGTVGWPASWACVNGLPNIAAMADFARQTVAHYKSTIHYWEIFNEVNFKFNYCGADNPSHYAELLKACYTAIKQEDPTAFVIPSGLAYPNAGAGTEPISFINTLYAQGAKNYMDALNIHPYTYNLPPMSPESWNPFSHLQNIRNIMLSNGDSAKKLWITEMGHSVCSTSECVNPDTQAQYLVWALGNATVTYDFIGPLIWYEWYDQGTNYADRESVYGIYDVNGNPRPAAAAFAASIGPPTGQAPVTNPPTPPPPTPAAGTTLRDLGAGCCTSLGAPVFNGANPNCASDCLANANCKTAVYGWNDGYQWCMTYNAVCMGALATGATDCGSSGNNGVHTYVKTTTTSRPTVTTSRPTISPPAPTASPPAPTAGPPANLLDRGAGCDPTNTGDISNAANPNCLANCLANSNCKCVIYGWANSQWCRASSVACTAPLNSGPTDCGSSGNNGVHTYVRSVSSSSSVTMKDQGAGCPAYLSLDLFNAANANCLAACIANPKCQTATYGWASSTWCGHYSAAYAPPLLSGSTDCGSSGNNGVHTYSKTTTVTSMAGEAIPVMMLPVLPNATFNTSYDPVWDSPVPSKDPDVSSTFSPPMSAAVLALVSIINL